jgi:hypothetical protein
MTGGTTYPISTSPSLPARFNWRDVLSVHPAAELFPPLSHEEFVALSEDIRANGLRTQIVLWDENGALIDGRHRLDALAALGLLCLDEQGRLATTKAWNGKAWVDDVPRQLRLRRERGDPYAIAYSLNIPRRHLTPEGKRDLIAKLLKANPTKSNRQIAKIVDASHPHVAKVRSELEEAGDVETVTTSVDTKGRKQPARRPPRPRPRPINPSASQGAPNVNTPNEPTKPPSKAMPRASSHIEILRAWGDASPEARARAISSIGLPSLLATIPADWFPLIEAHISDRRQMNGSAIPASAPPGPLPDGLPIPELLRREPLPSIGETVSEVIDTEEPEVEEAEELVEPEPKRKVKLIEYTTKLAAAIDCAFGDLQDLAASTREVVDAAHEGLHRRHEFRRSKPRSTRLGISKCPGWRRSSAKCV